MPPSKIIYSFVVDDEARFSYQAWHLARSLVHHCAAEPSAIHVQFLPECGVGIRAAFRDAGYTIHQINRFGDGRFCNKLVQIENLNDLDFDIVVLLDTDMIAISDLRLFLSSSHITAKVVDCPNPPLTVLDQIAHAAGLTHTLDICQTDDGTGETYVGNCNGGYYAVPKHFCTQLSQDWQRWALWLLQNIDFLRNAGAEIHVDQVSFWIAVKHARFPFQPAPSNVNYYVHFAGQHVHFDPSQPIALIHYHSRAMNAVGMLECSWALDDWAQNAINQSNTQIVSGNRHMPLSISSAERKGLGCMGLSLDEFLVSRKGELPARLIFHAGTSKTGTTSLQFCLNENRDELKRHGFLYPTTGTTEQRDPKHQWIVNDLLSVDEADFIKRFADILEERDENTHTIFLSTEGIANHWWDFPDAGNELLKIFARHFDTSCWVWLREPTAYFSSYYNQMVRNPQVPHIPGYGKDLSAEESVHIPWIIRHIDYQSLIDGLNATFGAHKVYPFSYSTNIVDVVSSLLRIPIQKAQNGIDNTSLRYEAGIDLVRIINRYGLPGPEKRQAVELIAKLDEIIGPRSALFDLNDVVKSEIQRCATMTASTIEALGDDGVTRWNQYWSTTG